MNSTEREINGMLMHVDNEIALLHKVIEVEETYDDPNHLLIRCKAGPRANLWTYYLIYKHLGASSPHVAPNRWCQAGRIKKMSYGYWRGVFHVKNLEMRITHADVEAVMFVVRPVFRKLFNGDS